MVSAAISYSWPKADMALALRRLLVVFMALALLWPFVRPALAELLVDRALGVLVQGDYGQAQRYINRAMWLDPNVTDVVDVDSFLIGISVTPAQLRKVRMRMDTYVALHPDDANVRQDRMVLEMRMRDYPAALRDVHVLEREKPHDKQLPAVEQAINTGLSRGVKR